MGADSRRPTDNGGGLHVLVVADDPDTAESTASLLRCFGHRVEVAQDVHSACEAARNTLPDAILLEIVLPDLDGWEVAGRMQGSSWEKKPFRIALADSASEEDQRRSQEAGIDLHLVKPVAPDLLRRSLERFSRIIMPTRFRQARSLRASWLP